MSNLFFRKPSNPTSGQAHMNSWLEIPLDEYEAHMSMASVAQAQYLAGVLGRLVQDVRPASVAIIG